MSLLVTFVHYTSMYLWYPSKYVVFLKQRISRDFNSLFREQLAPRPQMITQKQFLISQIKQYVKPLSANHSTYLNLE